MSANFSDLQSVDTANGADQMMLRLNNGATGPDGFARIEISDLNSLFTSNLTASDANVKQLSAQWSAAYSEVFANSGVFTLTVANSSFWTAAYNAVTGTNFNFGDKFFDYVTILGPATNIDPHLPVFRVRRNSSTTADMVQVQPIDTTSLFRITTAGSVGININETYTFATNEALYVNGAQRIDGPGGTALVVNGDLFVNGSLSALSATFINSIVTNTSALSVTNAGQGPALFVNQIGNQPIVSFKSDAAIITFAYNGDITGFRDLSGTGRIIAGTSNTASNAASYILGTNNNDNNNANVIILGSNISASVNDYTYVQNLSTTGIIAAGIIAAGDKTSVDWNNTYTAVNAQSASNASVYSSFNAQSAANASVYSTTNANSATWGSFGTSFNVVSAINTSALTAVGLSTNINAALAAKGTGATLAQIPDNAAAGGNARGQYATDWQKFRSVNTQVASGNHSTIGGGSDNTAGTGAYATVGGGYGNAATNTYSTIGGGYGNDATNTYSTIGGGVYNDATGGTATIGGGAYNNASAVYATIGGGASNASSGYGSTVGGGTSNATVGENSTVGGGQANTIQLNGQYATIGGGSTNTASIYAATIGGGYNNYATGNSATIAGGNGNTAGDIYSTVGGGVSNAASGIGSTVVGGSNNSANGKYSTSLGYGASATNYGEFAVSGGYFNSFGDNKSSTFLLRTTTIAPGSAVAYLDHLFSTNEITLPPNSTYAYTATIVGLSSHSNASGLHYILRGFAKSNNLGVVAIYPATSDLTQRIPATLNAGMSAAGSKLRVVVNAPTTAVHYWTARVQGEYIQF